MVKYLAAAAALKCFSAGPAMRRLYRGLGNGVGNRRRSAGSIPGYYVERLDRMLSLVKRHGIVGNGDRILELGTGWLHWEALTLRLFFDIEAVLFDVWDNRQLGGMKNYLGQLKPLLNTIQGLSDSQVRRAQFLIDQILGVESFEELYRLLGFEYVVDPSGSLERFSDCSFQLVVSAGVLEHVNRGALPTLIAETRRLLKPGGWALHSIDTSDHLSHYDKTVSAKKYLCFSDTMWQRFFDNGVQGINRVQRGEWLEMFRGSGFAIMDADGKRVDISGLKLAERFAHLDKRDLEYTVVRLALKAS